ncbi:MAG TPA: hypothetical protein VFH61_13875 [Thermoleophilia bacterium]|nr:hypothetical protein [Thermoleophilia bacterium]
MAEHRLKNLDPHDVTTKNEKISPSVAAKMLDDTEKCPDFVNRNLRQSHVDSLAGDMKVGNWAPNGTTIVIGTNKAVLDGQHRLWAIIESETTQIIPVARGVDPRAYVTIDTGMKRKTADFLKGEGIGNATGVASTLNWLHRLRSETMTGGTGSNNSLTSAEQLRLFHRESGIAEHAYAADLAKPLLPPSVAILCHYIFSQDRSREIADAFMAAIGEGTSLKKTDPVWALRERLIAARTEAHRRKLAPLEKFALCFKAWEMTVDGVSLARKGSLVWVKGREKFPYLDSKASARRRKARKQPSNRTKRGGSKRAAN